MHQFLDVLAIEVAHSKPLANKPERRYADQRTDATEKIQPHQSLWSEPLDHRVEGNPSGNRESTHTTCGQIVYAEPQVV